MSVGRTASHVLLLAALIMGVLSMHAVAAPVAHSTATHSAVAAPVDHAPEDMAGVEMPSQAPTAASEAAGHGSGPSSVLHDLMHLCLAVMAGLVLLIATLVLVWVVAATDRAGVPSSRAVAVRPARPPPRTAVRLAQLCVLRT
ncbi:DUF6153 family protein [Pseudonocardia sp. CA-107938]|uniref:DUF6153 family protein n=1 Tax=Pseudonocardia sp. CA-107938 TaxID=3240021 RepID=UPI003D91A818